MCFFLTTVIFSSSCFKFLEKVPPHRNRSERRQCTNGFSFNILLNVLWANLVDLWYELFPLLLSFARACFLLSNLSCCICSFVIIFNHCCLYVWCVIFSLLFRFFSSFDVNWICDTDFNVNLFYRRSRRRRILIKRELNDFLSFIRSRQNEERFLLEVRCMRTRRKLKITLSVILSRTLEMKFEKEKYYPFIALSFSIQSPNEIEKSIKFNQMSSITYFNEKRTLCK